jgi:hypothetical protein
MACSRLRRELAPTRATPGTPNGPDRGPFAHLRQLVSSRREPASKPRWGTTLDLTQERRPLKSGSTAVRHEPSARPLSREMLAADDEQERNRDSRSLAKGAGFDALRNAPVTLGLDDRDTGAAPTMPQDAMGLEGAGCFRPNPSCHVPNNRGGHRQIRRLKRGGSSAANGTRWRRWRC